MSRIRDVGTVIHVLRVIRQQSQGELARVSGVRNSSISNYERGKAVPKFETLQKLADGLGVPLSAVAETQVFIDRVREATERDQGAGVALLAAEETETSAADAEEGERIAAEVGRVAHRFTRLLFRALEVADRPGGVAEEAPEADDGQT